MKTAAAADKLAVAQLLATRDTLYATISQIDACLLAHGVDVDRIADPPVGAGCAHPADLIVNHHTTLDDKPDDHECQACGARQSTPFHSED